MSFGFCLLVVIEPRAQFYGFRKVLLPQKQTKAGGKAIALAYHLRSLLRFASGGWTVRSVRFPSLSSASAFMPSLSSANRLRTRAVSGFALALNESFMEWSTV